MIQSLDAMTPRLVEPCFVHETAVLIGDVRLSPHVGIWPGAVIRADCAPITIGEHSNIQDNCVLHTGEDHPIVVGPRVAVGHCAILHGCTVEAECIIGMGACVLNGAVVGRGCVVAAGALVPQGMELKPGTLYMGMPAKPARLVTAAEREKHLKEIAAYWEFAQRMKDTARTL